MSMVAPEAEAGRARFLSLLQQLRQEYDSAQDIRHGGRIVALGTSIEGSEKPLRTASKQNGMAVPHAVFSLDGSGPLTRTTADSYEIQVGMSTETSPKLCECIPASLADLSFSALHSNACLLGNHEESPDKRATAMSHSLSVTSGQNQETNSGTDLHNGHRLAPWHGGRSGMAPRVSESSAHLKRFREQFHRLDEENLGALSIAKCKGLIQEYVKVEVSEENLLATVKFLSGTQLQVDEECYFSFDSFLHLMRTPMKRLEDVDSESQLCLTPLYRAFDLEEAVGLLGVSRERYGNLMDIIPAPVILANALVLGIRPDNNPEAPFWDVLDLCFLCFYILEAIAKSCYWGCKTYLCGRDKYWNLFDLACIFISLFDVVVEKMLPLILSDIGSSPDMGDLMLIKMIRLARLARLVRALRLPVFNELKTIIFGVISGLRVLLWAIVLLVVNIYFFGVTMNGIAGREEHLSEFRSVPSSMFTIFRCFTDGCAAYDGTPLQERLFDTYGAWFMIAYILVFMFVTFGLFNLIMAIFIDNVVSSATTRRQIDVGATEGEIRTKCEKMFAKMILLTKQLDLTPSVRQQVEEQLEEDAVKAFDLLPSDLTVPHSVFNAWAESEDFVEWLGEADIDMANQLQLFDVLDADMSGRLELSEIIEGLVRLRGSSTKSDMVAMALKIEYIVKCLQHIGKKLGIDASVL